MALIREYTVPVEQVRVEGGCLVIDGSDPVKVDARNAALSVPGGPVLTWGMYQGALCFFVDGKLVKRADQYALAGLLRDISKAVSEYDME